VLDFRNDADAIREAFEPWYGQTVAPPSDPNLLYDTRHALDEFGVLDPTRGDRGRAAARGEKVATTHERVHAALTPAVDRFHALDDDEQDAFRDALNRFVRTYSFLSQIVEFTDIDLERDYLYGKALLAGVDLLGPDRESTHLEYKATLRTHADSGETFKPLETASLKTIAAFMNSREGGTLLIGVADDGTVHGLESDYASRSKTDQDPRDWFLQHLANIISTSMGDAAATLVRPQIHQVNGGEVCRVQVDPAGFPVDAKVIIQKPGGPKETRTEFYVRIANGTKALDAVEREKYIAGRWGALRG
jgi:hypothetical protein